MRTRIPAMAKTNEVRLFAAFGPLFLALFILTFSPSCAGGDDDDDDSEAVILTDENDTGDGVENDTGSDNNGSSDADQEESAETIFAPLSPDGQTVAYVEPVRYLGKWYEIATIPIFFQLLCEGSMAEYGYVDETTISVRNECALGSLNGPLYAVDGRARIVDSSTNARLSVSFGPSSFDFLGAPYWVIELDGSQKTGAYEKYEWAIVGSPSKNYLWILSRTPQVEETRLQKFLDRLVERGYDLDKLSFTRQPEK